MITVLGHDGSPLPPGARHHLAAAALVVAEAGILPSLGLPEAARVRTLPGDGMALLDEIDAGADDEVVVVVNGDPGFFGIVRELRRRGHRLRVVPAVSTVGRAFARAGLPWDDALVVSARDGGLRRAVNACRAHPKVAVLTEPGAGPAELARALFPQSPRAFVVCEDLGGPDERVVHVRPAEATTRPWRDPDVVLVLDPGRAIGEPGWLAGTPPGPGEWALPDESFGDRSVPSAEVRAFALAKLGPRVGDLVWDVDGGGAVAIECARFGAAAVAVARDPAVCEQVRGSVRAHGVKVAVSRGEPPAVFEHLADPDAIFIAEPAPEVLRACAARTLRTVVATVTDAVAVGPCLEALGAEGLTTHAISLWASPVGEAPGSPVFLVWGVRGAGAAEQVRAEPVRRSQVITPLPEEPDR